ncbi:MAG TPA: butyrate kinase [Bacteroidales bacterium]|nr:butyrate kinase [Bacteroidales bacterium]
MPSRLILAINPGSTSTKFALFEETELLFEKNLKHTPLELIGFQHITDQFSYRKQLIIKELQERNVDFAGIAAVVGRGGLVKSIESGVYRVNEEMKKDLREGKRGEHASNLGGLIAEDIAANLPSAIALIVDPVVVDELQPEARLSGHPLLERQSIFHALNQKAVARAYASSLGKKYEEMNLIVAHLGGGISIGAHKQGRVVDVNNALSGEGPFSPERSGGLPSLQLVELCFGGKYTFREIKSMLVGKGGMVAYLGTNDFREVSNRAASGDREAALVKDAAMYQVAKEIGAMATVLEGRIDAIILTGGIAHEKEAMNYLMSRIGFLSKVVLYPGEDEMRALAFNGIRALNGETEIREYA